MDNYLKMNQFQSMKKRTVKLRQDKGIKNEYEYIYKVLKGENKNTVIQDAFLNHRLLINSNG